MFITTGFGIALIHIHRPMTDLLLAIMILATFWVAAMTWIEYRKLWGYLGTRLGGRQ